MPGDREELKGFNWLLIKSIYDTSYFIEGNRAQIKTHVQLKQKMLGSIDFPLLVLSNKLNLAKQVYPVG